MNRRSVCRIMLGCWAVYAFALSAGVIGCVIAEPARATELLQLQIAGQLANLGCLFLFGGTRDFPGCGCYSCQKYWSDFFAKMGRI